MRCEVKLEIVPGPTHLFEESGALERVAQLAADWFLYHTAESGASRPLNSRQSRSKPRFASPPSRPQPEDRPTGEDAETEQ